MFLDTIYNVFSLNIGAIIWVRTRSNAVHQHKNSAYLAIGVMWTVACLGNLPTIIMVEYVKNPENHLEKCNQVIFMHYSSDWVNSLPLELEHCFLLQLPLLESDVATIVFEGLRLFVFNILVCGYLIRGKISHMTVKIEERIGLNEFD